MNGSKTVNDLTRTQVLAAVRSLPGDQDFVWDGVDEDDRPMTEVDAAPVRAAIAAKKRGRPVGSGKEQVALRIDKDVLEAFRASGAGWQTRMNEALRAWVSTH